MNNEYNVDNNPSSSPEGSLKALKYLFFAMMLILIGGAIFLFVTIYERNQAKTAPKECSGGILDISLQEEAVQMLQEGHVLTLLTKPQNNRQYITVFDYCSGKIIRHIALHKIDVKEEQ